MSVTCIHGVALEAKTLRRHALKIWCTTATDAAVSNCNCRSAICIHIPTLKRYHTSVYQLCARDWSLSLHSCTRMVCDMALHLTTWGSCGHRLVADVRLWLEVCHVPSAGTAACTLCALYMLSNANMALCSACHPTCWSLS